MRQVEKANEEFERAHNLSVPQQDRRKAAGRIWQLVERELSAGCTFERDAQAGNLGALRPTAHDEGAARRAEFRDSLHLLEFGRERLLCRPPVSYAWCQELV